MAYRFMVLRHKSASTGPDDGESGRGVVGKGHDMAFRATAVPCRGFTTMSERANLFIPQCDGSESVLEHVCRRFSEEYGGATVRRDHDGYWVDDDGNLVDDTVDVVFTYDSEIDRETLQDLAEHVKQELDEDAVLTSVESAETMMV